MTDGITGSALTISQLRELIPQPVKGNWRLIKDGLPEGISMISYEHRNRGLIVMCSIEVVEGALGQLVVKHVQVIEKTRLKMPSDREVDFVIEGFGIEEAVENAKGEERAVRHLWLPLEED